MIFIGIGGNIETDLFGTPLETCEAALKCLAEDDRITLIRCSRWYRSAPVPVSDQPWFVNGVAAIKSPAPAEEILELLHAIEADFGRQRRERNEARIIDLDVLDYEGRVITSHPDMTIPHPRLHERAFVLLPLAELAPDWRHPSLGTPIGELIDGLTDDQDIEAIEATGTT